MPRLTETLCKSGGARNTTVNFKRFLNYTKTYSNHMMSQPNILGNHVSEANIRNKEGKFLLVQKYRTSQLCLLTSDSYLECPRVLLQCTVHPQLNHFSPMSSDPPEQHAFRLPGEHCTLRQTLGRTYLHSFLLARMT